MTVNEPAPYENLIGEDGEMFNETPTLPGVGKDETFRLIRIEKIIDDLAFEPYFKTLRVKFEDAEHVMDFQKRFELPLTSETKTVVYPFDPNLCGGNLSDLGVLSEFPSPKKIEVKVPAPWQQMPEFVQPNVPVFYSLNVAFRTEAAFTEFAAKLNQAVTLKTKSIHFPKRIATKNIRFRWMEGKAKTCPRHPVYIVSRDRSDSMLTSQALAEIDVPHIIAIEQQDLRAYQIALEKFGLRDHVTLLDLGFKDSSDGPGRARNACWEHSVAQGATKHWVLDDNIRHFYRLNRNLRARVDSGAIFRAAEDFVDRYENVPVSGFQYRSMIAPESAYPAFVKNTRIYSTLLIDNKCPYKWRGKYNEDTDLSLRVLKDPS